MPQDEMPMDGGMEQDPMGGDMPPQDMPPMGGESEFDTNFDAGVEADEEQDPKKFIQQLTGKLSQSLRKYNEDNGQPDIDLNKYVAGMIVKQATEGLSQQDADEIIDKVKAGEDFENPEEGGQEMQEPPMDGGQEMSPEQPMEAPQPNESISRRHGAQIKEIVNSVLHGGSEEDEQPYQKVKEKGFRKKPFSSPNFEN